MTLDKVASSFDTLFHAAAGSLFSFGSQMFNEHVPQLFAIVAEDLSVVVTFFDVLLHDIEAF